MAILNWALKPVRLATPMASPLLSLSEKPTARHDARASIDSYASDDGPESRVASRHRASSRLRRPTIWIVALGVVAVIAVGAGLSVPDRTFSPWSDVQEHSEDAVECPLPREAESVTVTSTVREVMTATVTATVTATAVVEAPPPPPAPPLATEMTHDELLRLRAPYLPPNSSQMSMDFHNAFFPIDPQRDCPSGFEAYSVVDLQRRTAMASFPRSGNTWLRTTLERATGYWTGTVYAEDKAQASWFVKTHRADPENWARALIIVRNPLDAIYSYFHYSMMWQLGAKGVDVNTGRVDIPRVGSRKNHRKMVLKYAEEWKSFYRAWMSSPIPRLVVRYEDMLEEPTSQLLNTLAFLLPAEDRPPLSHVACSLAYMPDMEYYHSQRLSPFGSWDLWDPDTRSKVLKTVQAEMCRFDYGKLLHDVRGLPNVCE